MFDNAPLLVMFEPNVQRMFVTALALIIFVYGVTAAVWIQREIGQLFSIPRVRKFFKLKSKSEPDSVIHELVAEPENPVLYEVMWSAGLDDIYASNTRRRVVREPRDGARDLLDENGEGYIRYRIWLSDAQPWGMATWHTPTAFVLPKFPDYEETVVSTPSGRHSIVKTKVEDDAV